MTYKHRIMRQEALTEAIQIVNEAIGDEAPHRQSLRVLAALRVARDRGFVRVPWSDRIDYLERLQTAARAAWLSRWPENAAGPEYDAMASVSTPIGTLSAVIWRAPKNGGSRVTWSSEYDLAGDPITISEIRAAGLAQRPTSRNRNKK
jgi:hypothetical protein